MTEAETINAMLTTCQLEPVWLVWVELAARDDARVREAVAGAVGLAYGAFDRVAFESAPGLQFFHPREGSKPGALEETVEMPARVLSFSIPREPARLAAAIEAIRHTHSYQEPVIYVREALASRADLRDGPRQPQPLVEPRLRALSARIRSGAQFRARRVHCLGYAGIEARTPTHPAQGPPPCPASSRPTAPTISPRARSASPPSSTATRTPRPSTGSGPRMSSRCSPRSPPAPAAPRA